MAGFNEFFDALMKGMQMPPEVNVPPRQMGADFNPMIEDVRRRQQEEQAQVVADNFIHMFNNLGTMAQAGTQNVIDIAQPFMRVADQQGQIVEQIGQGLGVGLQSAEDLIAMLQAAPAAPMAPAPVPAAAIAQAPPVTQAPAVPQQKVPFWEPPQHHADFNVEREFNNFNNMLAIQQRSKEVPFTRRKEWFEMQGIVSRNEWDQLTPAERAVTPYYDETQFIPKEWDRRTDKEMDTVDLDFSQFSSPHMTIPGVVQSGGTLGAEEKAIRDNWRKSFRTTEPATWVQDQGDQRREDEKAKWERYSKKKTLEKRLEANRAHRMAQMADERNVQQKLEVNNFEDLIRFAGGLTPEALDQLNKAMDVLDKFQSREDVKTARDLQLKQQEFAVANAELTLQRNRAAIESDALDMKQKKLDYKAGKIKLSQVKQMAPIDMQMAREKLKAQLLSNTNAEEQIKTSRVMRKYERSMMPIQKEHLELQVDALKNNPRDAAEARKNLISGLSDALADFEGIGDNFITSTTVIPEEMKLEFETPKSLLEKKQAITAQDPLHDKKVNLFTWRLLRSPNTKLGQIMSQIKAAGLDNDPQVLALLPGGSTQEDFNKSMWSKGDAAIFLQQWSN